MLNESDIRSTTTKLKLRVFTIILEIMNILDLKGGSEITVSVNS